MKAIPLIITFVFLLGSSHLSFSQDVKIGYSNAEFILSYLPENRQLENKLASLHKELTKQIQEKQKHIEYKSEAYRMLANDNRLSDQESKTRMDELQILEFEFMKMNTDGEHRLIAKRQELMEPILKKIQNAINKVALENGFTLILNETNSRGISTILYGPQENNITEQVFTELGISYPTQN